MIVYYLFVVLLLEMIFFLNKKNIFILSVILAVFCLLYLPSNGFDYDAYKDAFDKAFFENQYPWFLTSSILTAEPLFIRYISFWGILIPGKFPAFLAINFVLSLCFSWIGLRYLSPKIRYHFWMMLFPLVFVVLFYASPRSSLSYILLFTGFVYLALDKVWIAVLLFFVACMLHSQYLLISIMLIITWFVVFYHTEKIKQSIKKILIISLCLFLFLFFIDSFLSIVGRGLSFLPSATIAVGKLNYIDSIESYSSGFRVTSILSIFIYPLLAYRLIKYSEMNNNVDIVVLKGRYSSKFLYLLFAIAMYGLAINIAFFNTPHVAGRLSRFSDYTCLGLLIPTYFTFILESKILMTIIMVFFTLLSLFVYY